MDPSAFRKSRLFSLAAVTTALLAACGGSVAMSGVAAGKVGRNLGVHAQTVPRGADVCAMQEAVAASPGAPDKPVAESCSKALKSDRVWKQAMIVLSAYADKLQAVASGTNPEMAGQLDAALTGVRGPDSIDAEGTQEQAARDAMLQLIQQMSASGPKGDLDKAIKDAAPHVKTICDGLGPYLETQLKNVRDVQKEIEKKRSTHADRRCANLDNKPICVSESVVDRLAYANAFGQIAAIESSHVQASDAVSDFCAAHRKLEEAAGHGQSAKDQTYTQVVQAVNSANHSVLPPPPSAKPGLPSKP